jgi:hypothetical protein
VHLVADLQVVPVGLVQVEQLHRHEAQTPHAHMSDIPASSCSKVHTTFYLPGIHQRGSCRACPRSPACPPR